MFILPAVSSLAAGAPGGPPEFLWAAQASGISNQTALAVSVDPAGNVVVTGFFTGTARFGGVSLTAAGLEDIFVAKYDLAGRLAWARQAGGQDYDEGRGVATDSAGNVYVTGHFQSTATFGPSNLVSAGQSDIFIAKYDPAGALLWASAAGGKDYDEAHAIAVDGEGAAYITGYFDATASFGGVSLPNNTSSDDIFVAKCDGNGSFVWARKAGGSLEDQGNSIALDGLTNVCVGGFFNGTATFGTNSLTSAGGGVSPDAFLARYDSAGNLAWVRQAGGTGLDQANGVAADPAGNIFLAGKFYVSASFDGTILDGKGVDIFLALYDSGGNLLWARRAGGNNSIYGDAALGVAADTNGNAFLTGYFSGTADFGTNMLASAAFDDIFCAKYSAGGDVLWARRAGGLDLDLACGTAADTFGNAVITGFFASGSIDFDGITLTNSGVRNAFVARLGVGIVPVLSAAAVGGQIVLSWPAAANGFVLESGSSLTGPDWSAVAGEASLEGTNLVLSVAAPEPWQFFRLRRQQSSLAAP